MIYIGFLSNYGIDIEKDNYLDKVDLKKFLILINGLRDCSFRDVINLRIKFIKGEGKFKKEELKEQEYYNQIALQTFTYIKNFDQLQSNLELFEWHRAKAIARHEANKKR